jgi:iron only hydrogenase large subunit-like protein
VETANVVTQGSDGKIKVDIAEDKCIACGECIDVCQHDARTYADDLERFLDDLKRGERISVIIAPAVRANRYELGRLIAWFKSLGVVKVHDVSLGADLCIWAHVRYLQQHPNSPIITQPCPAIVNYILKYHPSLIRQLSPVHSPMACSAICMKRYEKIDAPIVAISPCVAKSHEFESTGLIKYNVTFEKLFKYIDEHGINLPAQLSDFDHYQCGLGSVFSTPGGLKENIEYFLGNTFSIDRSEGKHVVYRKLDEYASQERKDLPDVFDVLNCDEGCNKGPASGNLNTTFQMNRAMDKARKTASENRDRGYYESLYAEYDAKFQLDHFLRRYAPTPVAVKNVTNADIEQTYALMDKDTDIKRKFDCSACGSDTCYKMARKIALHVNIPENCLQLSKEKSETGHRILSELHKINLDNAAQIEEDVNQIKDFVEKVWSHISLVNDSISGFDKAEKTIDDISLQINIIAINASIEAARLGESGKAFGVIADEVRRLSKATQETMTENSMVFNSAESTMREMSEMIRSIMDIVTTAYKNIQAINLANNEQYGKRECEAD